MNLCYVVPLICTYILVLWHTSWANSGNTMTAQIFEAKLEWDDDETILYNTIITSAGVIGMIPGSIIGGTLIQKGRRRAAIIVQVGAIIACTVTMREIVECLAFGRFLLGIAGGCMNVIFSKVLAENFSDRLAVRFGFLTNVGIACGIWACMSLGVVLPDIDDVEANKANETWRIVFMTPAILGLFVMVMLLTVFKEDTITYCV